LQLWLAGPIIGVFLLPFDLHIGRVEQWAWEIDNKMEKRGKFAAAHFVNVCRPIETHLAFSPSKSEWQTFAIWKGSKSIYQRKSSAAAAASSSSGRRPQLGLIEKVSTDSDLTPKKKKKFQTRQWENAGQWWWWQRRPVFCFHFFLF
jgi:hypothetical protein